GAPRARSIPWLLDSTVLCVTPDAEVAQVVAGAEGEGARRLMVVAIGTPTGFRRFFSRPLVGILGSVASIISVPLAILFYVQSVTKRDIVYAVYPLRTYLARAERPSDLRVEFKGQPISSSDVIAVQ